MGFRYKQQSITLDNYRQVFSSCTPDVLDEIRSAILDDTPIGQFISVCGDDDYKLGQIRKAIRELVPTEYLNTSFTGKTLSYIRKGIASGYDMSELLKYANKKGLSLNANIIETLAEFLFIGVNLSQVDFTYVPSHQVPLICEGLFLGYPMWLLVDKDISLETSQIELLMRGMQLGIDIHPFIRGDWKEASLVSLFSYSKKLDINKVLPLINSRFSTDSLKVLLKYASEGISIERLCLKDNEGYPVFDAYQMDVLGTAIKEGLDNDRMFNPCWSAMDINELLEKERAKRNRVLSVSLNKNS